MYIYHVSLLPLCRAIVNDCMIDVNKWTFLSCSVCKWKVLQWPKACHGRWFLLFRAPYPRKHVKSSWISCHSCKCCPNCRTQHPWHLLGSCWLCPIWPKPSSHSPRATEILVVLEGTLYVDFVISNPENRLISKVLNKGDVFVFPIGLIHFQFNIGHTNAVAIAALSSQNPGVITIANAVLGSDPPISIDVLTKAFQLDKDVVNFLQSSFWWDNN